MKNIFTSLLFLAGIAVHAQQLTVTQVASGFTSPVDIKHCGDERLFIVERPGYIRILDSAGSIMPGYFLDIHTRVLAGGERGLLGMAFDPHYASNGYFYVNYTSQPSGHTHISRFSVDISNPDSAVASSEEVLLEIFQPYSNHNGGHLAFGPDGYLYIGMGDGGSSGDPGNRAQNLDSLLGKMLRIDVSAVPGYTSPTSNPFVGIAGRDEIWAYGLRNPWRFSFDRLTGDLWIGDVGQGNREEIDMQPAASAGGENYGWKCYEGDLNYVVGPNCPQIANTAQPVYVYSHSGGNCSVTGGYVYRGAEHAAHFGEYFFADYCVTTIRSIRIDTAVHFTNYGSFTGSDYVSWGENKYGEIFVSSLNGQLYKLGDTSCLPVAHIADSDTLHVCGSSVMLSTPEGKNFTYSWTANGSTVPGNNLPYLNVIQSGTYAVAVTNPALCSNISADVYVSLDSIPVVSFAGLDTQYCYFDPPVALIGTPPGGTFSGPGVTGNLFTPWAAGTGSMRIAYSYTTAEGCTDSSARQTEVVVCIGIPGVNQLPVSMSPNPFDNSITVKGATRVEIFNVVGSKIMERNCEKKEEIIDTSKLSPGIYFIRLFSGQMSRVEKIVRE